jgi:pimeloyl-ACP methyl ester carboxylesterase
MSRRQGRGQCNFIQRVRLGKTALLSGALLLLGCGSDADLIMQPRSNDAGAMRTSTTHSEPNRAPDGDGGPSQTDEADPIAVIARDLELDWENCSLYTGERIGERPFDEVAGAAGPPAPPASKAKCATLELPLRWDEAQGSTLSWFVKKVPATEPSRGQVWLLQGGPGSSGVGLEHLADVLSQAVPDLDVYIPDHRGVGRSTLFECDGAMRSVGTTQDQIAACGWELVRDWGEDTQAFGTTSAARDVVAVATALHRPSDEVVVWGGSYGGYWAHRVLQADENALFTAALFDSSALPTGGLSTLYQTLKPREAGDALLAACAEDAECSARLGPDPRQRALEILDDLCAPLRNLGRGGRVGLQGLVSTALREWRLLRLIPAILYRAERCDDADVDYLDSFSRQLGSGEALHATEVPDSAALFLHIMFTEVISELSELRDIVVATEGEVFSDLSTSVDWRAALADWPHYPEDEFTGRWADTEIPMLLLRGGLDTQTPLSEGQALADRFRTDSQQSFFFPTGGHGVYYRTHDLEDGVDTSCGAHITHQFLRSPTTPVDASCIDDTPPLDFAADEQVLLDIAGHTNVWDNLPEAAE